MLKLIVVDGREGVVHPTGALYAYLPDNYSILFNEENHTIEVKDQKDQHFSLDWLPISGIFDYDHHVKLRISYDE